MESVDEEDEINNITETDNETLNIANSLYGSVKNIYKEKSNEMKHPVSDDIFEDITRAIYHLAGIYATDLELFAKHGKRTTINPDDVKLLVRRNKSLGRKLTQFQNTLERNKE